MKKLYFTLFALTSSILLLNGQNKAIFDTIFYPSMHFDSATVHNYCFTTQFHEDPDQIWQVGTPSKATFDSSYSAYRALITDSIHPYPAANHSYFDLLFNTDPNCMVIDQLQLEFWHRFDTDTMHDGGYITISYDNGSTWVNVIEDYTGFYGDSPYMDYGNMIYTTEDSLFNGEYGFSGNSNGWKKAKLCWFDIPAKSISYYTDPIIIRFNFISDDIDNAKAGWMIDDIRLFNVDLGGEIVDLSNTASFAISPNPANDQVTLIIDDVLLSNETVQIFNLTGKLVKSFPFWETEKGLKSFPLGETEKGLNISELEKGLYFVKIGTETQKLVIE